jgi:arylsulfatase A-like enzyme
VNADFGRHIDIAPTILQFAGLQKVPAMQGESIFTPTGDFANGKTSSVYSENDFENNVMQALRTRDCKLIHANPDNARNRAPVEAYNLAADPEEKTNIAGKNEKCETELEQILNQMTQFVRGQAAEPKKVSVISGEQTEQLKSLGYLDK